MFFINEEMECFWELEVNGKAFKETFGILGKPGRYTLSNFKTEEAAMIAAKKHIRTKVGEGFVQKVVDPMIFMKQVALG